MTSKLIRTQSKIFFPNPYVVRVEYDGNQFDTTTDAAYRKLVRNTYRLIKGTWGHSALIFEVIRSEDPAISAQAQALTQTQIWAAIFSSVAPTYTARRGYFCFKDELDALQFRLSIDTTAIQVVMWPNDVRFTIHEVVETDEQ